MPEERNPATDIRRRPCITIIESAIIVLASIGVMSVMDVAVTAFVTEPSMARGVPMPHVTVTDVFSSGGINA